MNDRHPGIWVGLVAMLTGLAFVLLVTDSDAFALGGAGLIVVGALAIAVSIEDSSRT